MSANAQPFDGEDFSDVLITKSDFADPIPDFPAELKQQFVWLVEKDKTPHSPRTGRPANDCSLGVQLPEAAAFCKANPGFGLGVYLRRKVDPAVPTINVIDLDHCIGDDGTVELWAAEIIHALGPVVYIEISRSGKGLHIWFYGVKPGNACRRGIEWYDHDRYLTCNGNKAFPERPSVIGTVDSEVLKQVYEKMIRGDFVDAKEPSKEPSAKTEPKQSAQIEQGSAVTTKLQLLMTGEVFSTGNPFEIGDRHGNKLKYESHSHADLALATLLAFKHEGDAEKIDSDFRSSPLMRSKWDREDYAKRTIDSAVDFYKKSKTEKAQPAVASVSTSTIAATQADSDWHSQFRSVGKLQTGGTRMLIKDLLPEGIFMIGGLSGVGKTFFGLSLAKALTTGKPFLGQFTVPEIVPVLYLIPELSGPSFRARCEKFQIPDDENLFLCRTITEGATLALNDPAVIAAVQHLRPVVMLDTSIRFNKSDDENSATANKVFVNELLGLRAAGARAIGGIQHSRKDVIKMGFTLENVLRGTGDLGAMAQCVYGLRRNDVLYEEGNGPLTLEVLCLKAPDFTAPRPFAIAATVKKDNEIVSCIDTTGDFLLLEPGVETQEINGQFVRIVDEHRDYSLRQVAEALGISKRRVQSIAEKLKVRKTKAGWIFGNVKNDVSDDPNAAKDIEETTTDARNKTPSQIEEISRRRPGRK
jgi:AAA domain/NrS-1  polymerase HBD domain